MLNSHSLLVVVAGFFIVYISGFGKLNAGSEILIYDELKAFTKLKDHCDDLAQDLRTGRDYGAGRLLEGEPIHNSVWSSIRAIKEGLFSDYKKNRYQDGREFNGDEICHAIVINYLEAIHGKDKAGIKYGILDSEIAYAILNSINQTKYNAKIEHYSRVRSEDGG